RFDCDHHASATDELTGGLTSAGADLQDPTSWSNRALLVQSLVEHAGIGRPGRPVRSGNRLEVPGVLMPTFLPSRAFASALAHSRPAAGGWHRLLESEGSGLHWAGPLDTAPYCDAAGRANTYN